jgi:uncharacterized ferritin-like protein (DUF455 family)
MLERSIRNLIYRTGVDVLKSRNVDWKMQQTLNCINDVFSSRVAKSGLCNDLEWLKGLEMVTFPGRPDFPIRFSDPTEIPKAHKLNPPMQLNAYMLHSIAHIELNAVELYWDTLLRFAKIWDSNDDVKRIITDRFIVGILNVLRDEATHFNLCRDRLIGLKSFYGACPVHDRQWERADEVKDDPKSRIVILSLVQEARGLDASPKFIHKLKSMGDQKSAQIVEKICNDEVKHVAFGMETFKWLCKLENSNCTQMEEIAEFQRIVKKHVPEGLMPPLNEEQRNLAGMPAAYYLSLVHKR